MRIPQTNAVAGWVIRLFLFVLPTLLAAMIQNSIVMAESAEQLGEQIEQRQAAVTANAICNAVSATPAEECRALVALFEATSGANWKVHSNWLTISSAASPCDWYGVVCQNGHVGQLHLNANRLDGGLPASLSNLTELKQLNLANNLISAPVPLGICVLARNGVAADFAYNRINPATREIDICLAHLDADWKATQTVPPNALIASEIFTDAVRLTWTPISYTADTGFYEISVAQQLGGPFVQHGKTADKSASSYLVDGLQPGRTYFIRMRTFTAAHGDQTNHLFSNAVGITLVTRTEQRALVAVYFAADNDLSPYIRDVRNRLRRGSAANPNVDVVYLADGDGDHDTVVWWISNGVITTTNAVSERWGLDELDTGDPAVLSWFLSYARASSPATRTLVSLLGHGVGLTPEIEWGESTAASAAGEPAIEAPPLPREKDATATDLTNGSYLSTVDYGVALAAATDNGAAPFDLVFFDHCFQGSLDALYEVRSAARVFVASPNYAWLSAPYDAYLSVLAPSAAPEAMAEAIINIYQGSLDNQHPNAIFWVSSQQISDLATSADTLANALLASLQGGVTEPIRLAATHSRFVDTAQCGDQTFHLAPPDEMIGIGLFARRLQESFGAGDSFGVYNAAETLATQAKNVHKTYRVGAPYIAPDEFWEYDDVLTILAPLARNTGAGTAWRASTYRANSPFAAIWAEDPTVPLTITASLASARDGKWDEFLAAWYTKPLLPTVGQWCRYTPPAVVISDTATVISLTVTSAGADAAQLQWTGVAGAEVYHVLVKLPESPAWVLAATAEADVLSSIQSKLSVGQHRFRIVALGGDDVVIAQSEATSYQNGAKLYLPVVQR